MGGRARRTGAGLRTAVALLADVRWRGDRPDRKRGFRHPPQSGFAAPHRHGVESGRRRQDGAATMPLPVPVLRRERSALLSALPALGRRVPRRAVQYRLLRVANADGGAGDRTEARGVRAHARRRTSLPQSPRAGAAAALARTPAVAEDDAQYGRERSLRLPL